MGSRALAGERVAASATRLRGQGRRPVSAREGKEGEGGTDGARKTAAAERFTSAAAEGAAARLAGRRRVQGAGFLCGEVGGEGGREDAEGLLHRRRGAPDGRRWRGGRLHGGGACAKVERCGACTGAEKGVRKARSCLYRLGKRRGSGVRANWPSMAMAAGPALMAFKEASVSGVRGRGKGWGSVSECTAH
jgi:hypothetical protein